MSLMPRARSIGRHRGKSPAQLKTDLDEAICIGIAQQTLIAQLSAERNRLEAHLDQAGIDVSGALEDLRVARAETARSQAALTAVQARLANATAASDLPQHVSTQPVPTLQQRFASGRVVHIGASPQAGVEDTQPLPAVASAT